MQGVTALRAGECDRAIVLFERSIASEDKLSSRHNLGIALERCGRVLESVAVLEELVARMEEGTYEPSSEERRAQVAEQLAHSRAQLGILRIQVPPGTPGSWRVEVDGTDRGRLTESRPLRQAVDPGQHHIRAWGESGQSLELTLDRSAGRGEVVRAVLEPAVQEAAPGRLRVEAEGLITVVGQGQATDSFDEELSAGRYEIRAQGRTRHATVESGGTVSIQFESAPSRTWIWVVAGVVLAGGLATALVFGLRDDEPDFDFRAQGLRFGR